MLNHMKIYHYPEKRNPVLTVLILAVCLSPLAVTAGIYKWTDADGNVHYGSQKPVDTTAEKMKIKEGKPKPYGDPNAPEEKKGDIKEDPDKKGEEKKKPEAATPEKPKEPQISKKQKQVLCAQARKNLATISSRGRVRVTDEKGERRHLNDAERAKELAAAQKNISKYCK